MDKFAQISLDFFNQPSPPNGDKEPVNAEPANQAHNGDKNHENAEPVNPQNGDKEPVNAEPSNEAPRVDKVPGNVEFSHPVQNGDKEPGNIESSYLVPKVEMEEQHPSSPTAYDEPVIIPEPNYIGPPANDLVSMLADDDHPDIIDFTILGEKEVSYDQELVSKSTRGRKSLKSFDRQNGHPEIPSDDILNKKQYYSIGEVAVMFRVNPSLLRFWEAEFDIIQPRKNKKGDRHFRPIDIRNLELIYDLLRRRKLTIEGAREYLKQNSRAKERYDTIQSLQKIRSFLLELKANL